MRSMTLAALLFLVLAPPAGFAEAPPTLVDGWEAVRTPVKPFEVKDLRGQPLRLGRPRGEDRRHRLLGLVVQALHQGAPGAGRLPPAPRRPVGRRSPELQRRGGPRGGRGLPEDLPGELPRPLRRRARRAARAGRVPHEDDPRRAQAGKGGSATVRFRREGLTRSRASRPRVAALLAEPPADGPRPCDVRVLRVARFTTTIVASSSQGRPSPQANAASKSRVQDRLGRPVLRLAHDLPDAFDAEELARLVAPLEDAVGAASAAPRPGGPARSRAGSAPPAAARSRSRRW